MLVDFAFYKYNYHGTVFQDNDQFEKWIERAEMVIHRYTLNRPLEDNDKAKKCICEIAELEYAYATEKRVTSASNDGYSESYQVSTYENERREIIKDWLSETDLLFRGAS